MTYPTIRILKGHDARLRGGHPWLFSNELRIDEAAKALEPGAPVRLMAPNGNVIGVAQFNPHSLIAGRLLSRNKDAVIDGAFLERRVERALGLRQSLFERPFYRLVHAEGDGLPGLVVDRFGDDHLVVQMNAAGIDRLREPLLAALSKATGARNVLARNDAPVRLLEGLGQGVEALAGAVPGRLWIEENGLPFLIDPHGGQKTGWFYDQRLNRAFVRGLARGADVLDLYSHSGGFGLGAAAGGAASVTLVDGSGPALDLARESAARQGVEARVETVRSDAFKALEGFAAEKRRFGLVVADPPAFVRSRKDLAVGLRTYRKLARDAAAVTAEPGFLCIACCSHNVEADAFAAEVWGGIRAAGRGGRLLHRAFAGPDHPVHPALPETAYLKFLAYALD